MTFKDYVKENPGQIFPPILVAVVNILVIFVLDVEGTIYFALSQMIVWALIGWQWISIQRSMVEKHKKRLEEDKTRLQDFIEQSGLHGIPGSIRFLKPFKEKWYRAWYYNLKRTTRLSLYVFGNTDEIGSYIKVPVSKAVFFHLSLMGCTDTESPELCVKGMDYIAVESRKS